MGTVSYTAVHLRFGGGLHLSRRSDDLGKSRLLPTSDSLKAALTACHAQLLGRGRTEGELLAFMDSFRLSNAFPWDGNTHRYLPVPVGQWPLPGHGGSDAQSKALRKQRYLPYDAFVHMYVDGGGMLEGVGPQPEQKRQLVQRVQVARPWEGMVDALPYMVEELRWTPGKGLWCLLECADPMAQADVMAAWRLLGDQGLGQGKTLGGGHFSISCSSLSLQVAATGHWMALGNFLPGYTREGGLQDRPVAWTLEQVGGFMAGSSELHHRRMLRRSIPMLGEGSIFRQPNAPQGRWMDLAPLPEPGFTPGHPVYRDGRCIFLPIHLHQPLPDHECKD